MKRPKDAAHFDLIVAELNNQFRLGGKQFFFTDLFDKFDNDWSAVQVPAEIEKMRLNRDAIAGLKRRPPADIGHSGKNLPIHKNLDRVDTYGGDHQILDENIGRWKPQTLAAAGSFDDLSHHRDRPSQKSRRPRQFSIGDQSSDHRTADFLPAPFHGPDDIHPKAVSRAGLMEIIQISGSILAETKIIADKNLSGLKPREITLDEPLRRQPGESFGEPDHDAGRYPQRLNQFQAMGQGNDIGEMDFRMKNPQRMRHECHHEGLAMNRLGPGDRLADQYLMTAVQTVEDTDGHNGAAKFPFNLSSAGYDFH